MTQDKDWAEQGKFLVGSEVGLSRGSRQGRDQPVIGQGRGWGISGGLWQGLSQPSPCPGPGPGPGQFLPDTWLKPLSTPGADPSSGLGPVRALIPGLGPGLPFLRFRAQVTALPFLRLRPQVSPRSDIRLMFDPVPALTPSSGPSHSLP